MGSGRTLPGEALSVIQFFESRPSYRIRKAWNAVFGRPDNRTGKPVGDLHYTGYEPRVQYPRLAIPYWMMYETMHLCPEARTVVNQLISETFRNRGEWHERFAVRCGACGLEMKNQPKDGLCARRSCRATVMVGKDIVGSLGIAPDDDELSFFNVGRKGAEWGGVKKVNRSGLSLWQLLRQVAFDLCTVDDAYIICVKKYHLQKTFANGGSYLKLFAEPVELVRGHPNVIRIVSDDYGNRGGVYYQCPAHRSKVYVRPGAGVRYSNFQPGVGQDLATYEGNTIPHEALASETCPVHEASTGRPCGLPLKNIHYVATDAGGAAPKQYYFEDECLHLSYYSPGVLYGVAPVVSLWRHLRSLIKQAEYVQTYFEKRRIPRGVVAVNTPRKEAIKNLKDAVNQQSDDNQHDIPFVAVEGSNQRGWIEFIPFADKLGEMDLQALREESRTVIGAFYGVSHIMQGDTSQGGGLNNEGLQLAVQNRSVEGFQHELFDEKLFPWIAEQFGIKDHEFLLNPSEEKDIAHELQLELMKQQVSGGKDAKGLRFRGVSEEGEYLHDDKPDPNHPTQQLYNIALNGGMKLPPSAQQPGQVQPGGAQPAPFGAEKQQSLSSEVASDVDGAPTAVHADGEPEDIF